MHRKNKKKIQKKHYKINNHQNLIKIPTQKVLFLLVIQH